MPQWVELAGPPQGPFLENRVLAEWAGSCAYCGAPHCLIGWIPVKLREQLGVRLKAGDGVLSKNGAVAIVTRPRARYIKARPVLSGGSLLQRRLGSEIDLQREDVVLMARYVLHPVPPCQQLQQDDEQQAIPDHDGVPMLASEVAIRRLLSN